MKTIVKKRQAGDIWGLIAIDLATGEKRAVQIGYWETTTFPYAKQAQEHADGYNKNAIKYKRNERYEIRYIRNSKTKFVADNSDVQGQSFAGWGW